MWHLAEAAVTTRTCCTRATPSSPTPAAGTGLSSHELNQPGTQGGEGHQRRGPVPGGARRRLGVPFPGRLRRGLHHGLDHHALDPAQQHCLTVGPALDYVRVRTFNPYTHEPQTVVLAKARLNAYFPEKHFVDTGRLGRGRAAYKGDGKHIPGPWTRSSWGTSWRASATSSC